MSVEAMLPFQAYRALSLIAHPAVRDFALVQMAQGKHIEHVIGLLVKNYEPGDWQLVHELVTQPHERETLHSMGMDVRRLMEKHNSPHAVPALTHLIEYGPCSQCRGEFYRGLDAIDVLSLLTKKEIAFDSYDYTREWAQERQT